MRKTAIILLGFFVLGLMSLSSLSMVQAIPDKPQDNLIFWTTETESTRAAIIEDLAAGFTGETVTVVTVDENELPEQIATAKAAGTLPDVMQVFYEYIGGYCDENILDAKRATTTIGEIPELGGLPMVANPVKTGDSDKYGAVPIDGWVQGIWYRTDLFEDEGLAAPSDFAKILAAAKALHNTTDPLNPMYGIVIGTHPKAVYTQQVYEHFAMANSARALDKDGKVVLNSENQKEALEYYADLANYAPDGFNNWDAANQLYLTGKCAMMFYSTYIADDILGLQERPWAPVTNLGNKTGFQAAITGNHEETATYGQLSALGITVGAHAESEAFIKYLINDDENYLDWIHMNLAGKMPLKQTTAILANWTANEIWGSYDGLAESILTGFKNIDRWGLIDGNSYSVKISKLYAELIMPKAIVSVISNLTDASGALVTAEKDFKAAIGETDDDGTDTTDPAPGFEAFVFLVGLAAITITLRKRRKK